MSPGLAGARDIVEHFFKNWRNLELEKEFLEKWAWDPSCYEDWVGIQRGRMLDVDDSGVDTERGQVSMVLRHDVESMRGWHAVSSTF